MDLLGISNFFMEVAKTFIGLGTLALTIGILSLIHAVKHVEGKNDDLLSDLGFDKLFIPCLLIGTVLIIVGIFIACNIR